MMIQAIIHVYSQERLTLRDPMGPETPRCDGKCLHHVLFCRCLSAASHQLQDRPSPSQVLLLMVWSSHKRRARVAPSAARSPSHGLALDCGQPDANNVCFLQITLQRSVSAAKPHKYAKILKRKHITFIPCFFLAETSHFFFSSSFLLLTLEGLPGSSESGLI